jgi:hypothetical protein
MKKKRRGGFIAMHHTTRTVIPRTTTIGIAKSPFWKISPHSRMKRIMVELTGPSSWSKTGRIPRRRRKILLPVRSSLPFRLVARFSKGP